MDLNKDLIIEALNLWDSFKKKIQFENRFFIEHEVLTCLEKLAYQKIKMLEENTIIYRARLFKGDTTFLNYLDKEDAKEEKDYFSWWTEAIIKSKNDSGFWGFDESNSFIPPDNSFIEDGRANPSFIKYLYAAEDPYTAMVEIRPYLESTVSIASIKVKEEIQVVDISFDAITDLINVEQILMYLIMVDFSKPSDSNKMDYLPTQYVAEFMKSLGFDGIRFTSSLHKKGRNITIFNYQKCQAVDSKLYKVNDICYEAEQLAPDKSKHLIHDKLKSYKLMQLSKLHHKLEK